MWAGLGVRLAAANAYTAVMADQLCARRSERIAEATRSLRAEAAAFLSSVGSGTRTTRLASSAGNAARDGAELRATS